MATLYIVATPIGNLQDMTLRAVDTLKSVDHILAEDTRVTAKLLEHFDIAKPMSAYHQHSSEAVIERAAAFLEQGRDIALVSDAGTPGINDPGGRLVSELLKRVPELKVVPIPGANAAVTALSVSGFPADSYSYLGFVPHKKGRQTFLRKAAEVEATVVFYESKYRIDKCLTELQAAFDAAGCAERPIMVARELTKKFETLYRGSVGQVLLSLQNDKELGEFVVVLGPKG
jgi:16S rRNA (cytidine1402-2'-O)-methyltransferase